MNSGVCPAHFPPADVLRIFSLCYYFFQITYIWELKDKCFINCYTAFWMPGSKEGGKNREHGSPAYSFSVPSGERCWQGAPALTELTTCCVIRAQSWSQWALSLQLTWFTHLFILCIDRRLIFEQYKGTWTVLQDVVICLKEARQESVAGFEKPGRFVAEAAFGGGHCSSIVGVEEGAGPALDYNQTIICGFLW